VPFFVFGENALGEGIGVRLSALDLPPAWYLVVTPQVCVSTKEIFAPRVDREVQSTQNTALFRGAGKERSRSGRERSKPRGERAARGFVARARKRA
jgi:4-diphosphocytidyl-2C-methyl-D-erythritol kinase